MVVIEIEWRASEDYRAALQQPLDVRYRSFLRPGWGGGEGGLGNFFPVLEATRQIDRGRLGQMKGRGLRVSFDGTILPDEVLIGKDDEDVRLAPGQVYPSPSKRQKQIEGTQYG